MMSRLGALRALPLLLAAAACGGPLQYTPRASAKAPEADVKITADVKKDQGETKLIVKVEHLAPPDRLATGGQHFVVWFRKNSDTPWQRVTSLKYDADGRKGVVEDASVPEVAFELEITDEPDLSPASPSADIIVAQVVGR